MERNYKPVNIETDLSDLGTFTDDKKVWKVTSLIYHAKDLEVFELPLCGIDISISVWGNGGIEIKNFAKHWKRANKVNLDYPIILDDAGFIMDGWHRVAKALFLGMATIKAVRFDKTPECDYMKVE